MASRAMDAFFRDLAHFKTSSERAETIGRYLRPHSPRAVRAFVGSFREVVVRGGERCAAALLEALQQGGAPQWVQPSCRARFVVGRPRTSTHESFAVHLHSSVQRVLPLADGGFLVLHRHGRGAWLRAEREWIPKLVRFADMRADRTDAIALGRRHIAGVTESGSVAIWRLVDGAMVVQTSVAIEPQARLLFASGGPWLVVATSGHLAVLRDPYNALVASRDLACLPDALELRRNPTRIAVESASGPSSFALPDLAPSAADDSPIALSSATGSPGLSAPPDSILAATRRSDRRAHRRGQVAVGPRPKGVRPVDAFAEAQAVTFSTDGQHAAVNAFARIMRVVRLDEPVLLSQRGCAARPWTLVVDGVRDNVVVPSSDKVRCYQLRDGALLWEASPAGVRAGARPVLAGSRVICPTHAGWVSLSAGSGATLVNQMLEHPTSVVAARAELFACAGANGTVSLHDAKDRVVWTRPIASAQITSLSFAGSVLLASSGERTFAVEITEGRVVDEIASASVVGSDDGVSSSDVVWLEPKSVVVWSAEARVWRKDVEARVLGVTATRSFVFVLDGSGTVHRFGGGSLTPRTLALAPQRGYPCLLRNPAGTALAAWDGSRVCILGLNLDLVAEWIAPDGISAVVWRDDRQLLVGDSLGHVVELSE